MAIRRDTVTLTADGSGDAVGYTRAIDGVILAVYVNFSASYDATNTVVIEEGGNSPALPVLTLTDVTTDGWYYPRITLHDVADGAEIVGPVDYQSVSDQLKITVAGAAEDDVLITTVVWDEMRSH